MNRTQKGDLHEKDRIAFHSLSVDGWAFIKRKLRPKLYTMALT